MDRFGFAFSDTLNFNALSQANFYYDIGRKELFSDGTGYFADDFGIGGTSASPNISLNSDGTASFSSTADGRVDIIGNGNGANAYLRLDPGNTANAYITSSGGQTDALY